MHTHIIVSHIHQSNLHGDLLLGTKELLMLDFNIYYPLFIQEISSYRGVWQLLVPLYHNNKHARLSVHAYREIGRDSGRLNWIFANNSCVWPAFNWNNKLHNRFSNLLYMLGSYCLATKIGIWLLPQTSSTASLIYVYGRAYMIAAPTVCRREIQVSMSPPTKTKNVGQPRASYWSSSTSVNKQHFINRVE